MQTITRLLTCENCGYNFFYNRTRNCIITCKKCEGKLVIMKIRGIRTCTFIPKKFNCGRCLYCKGDFILSSKNIKKTRECVYCHRILNVKKIENEQDLFIF